MKKRISICCFILIASFCQTIYADTLYMTDGSQARAGGSSSRLFTIDTQTMEATLIGDVGFFVADLAWDATEGVLYGSTSIHDPLHNGLITIDTNTGSGTPIGLNGWGTGVTIDNQRGAGYDTHVVHIDIDSSGNMFGGGHAVGENGSLLLKINKNNGTFSSIGTDDNDFFNTLVANDSRTLFFDASDKLRVKTLDHIFEMDTLTGAAEYTLNFDDEGLSFIGGVKIGGNSSSKGHGDFDRVSGAYWEIETSFFGAHLIHKYDISGNELVESIQVPNSELIEWSHKQPALAFAYENTQLSDVDSDGIPDDSDNCIEASNANQFDSDGDGYGNMCDPDVNNDGLANRDDMRLVYRPNPDYYSADADINGDGLNNRNDRRFFKWMNYQFGPSAFHNPSSDVDLDGIPNDSDNCIEASNANQFDSDGDGYGNMCDPDINNDGRVDEWDWYLAYGFSEDYDPYEEDNGDDRFLDYYLPDADINGDGLNDRADRRFFDDMHDQFGPSAFH